ncbi:FeoB-associated Cys-rich membrane protein [uncultured Oscillibacter sp.]
MNLASIIVLYIVASLFVISVVRSRKTGAGQCDGNCTKCAFRKP